METSHSYSDVLRRHALPEVLFGPDIAVALSIGLAEAEAGAEAGRFGPEFYVNGRVAVLRKDFIDTLELLGDARDASAKEVLP